MDVSALLEPVQVPNSLQTSKMLCFTKAAQSSCHQILTLHLCREKQIHFKSPHLLISKPALALYLLSTWTYPLINWNKCTSSSDIHKDIGQPIYLRKYMLSHLFLHLIIPLPPLSGIISVENTSCSLPSLSWLGHLSTHNGTIWNTNQPREVDHLWAHVLLPKFLPCALLLELPCQQCKLLLRILPSRHQHIHILDAALCKL